MSQPEADAIQFSDLRCSLCGASRLAYKGRPGVCTFVECPDPFHDLNLERAARPEPSWGAFHQWPAAPAAGARQWLERRDIDPDVRWGDVDQPPITYLYRLLDAYAAEQNAELLAQNCQMQDDIASLVSTHRADWSWADAVDDVKALRERTRELERERDSARCVIEWAMHRKRVAQEKHLAAIPKLIKLERSNAALREAGNKMADRLCQIDRSPYLHGAVFPTAVSEWRALAGAAEEQRSVNDAPQGKGTP